MKSCKLTAVVLSIILIFACSSAVCAVEEKSSSNLFNQVLCLARDGDSVNYPACSKEGILSCKDMGADMVSVSVRKTADGVLVLMCGNELSHFCVKSDKSVSSGLVSDITYSELSSYLLLNCDKTVSEYSPATLEDAIKTDIKLVLDDAWEYRDEIYSLARENSAIEKIMLRTDASAKEIAQWHSQNPDMQVIGVYSGNIIFAATKYSDDLLNAGLNFVQLQSGNYFAVIFQNFVMKRFSPEGRGYAIAAAYDKSLCGHRTDTVQGWDDLISRGYGVVETNQPKILVNYISQLKNQKSELSSLVEKAKQIDSSAFSSASVQQLTKAVTKSEDLLGELSSKGEVERSSTELFEALRGLCAPDSTDTQKKGLNITAGKIIAVILGAAAVITAQVYVHKRQKSKKSK